ncbi:MAG: DNA polymerase III subunit alpha [Bacilli bacterium]|nr:DNA polymerase III subunit alpha [Bacilli bacterium]
MFIPFGIKTDYEILGSLIKLPVLVSYLKDKNIRAVGICDNNLSYVMEFVTLCEKEDIKPIVGLEVSIDDLKLYLYAKNYNGYKELCKLYNNDISLSNINKCKDIFVIVPNESIIIYDGINIEKYHDEELSFKTVRCLQKEDGKYLEYLYLIKSGKTLKESEYELEDSYLEIGEDSPIFEKIYNEVDIKMEKNDLLPKYDLEGKYTSFDYLKSLCEKGLSKRLDGKVSKEYADRLYYELDVIKKMGFEDYFLVVWDYVKFAKKNNILVGPGRGSAAGSLVSYTLGITDIDPLKYNLYFERFLNPDRVTMPDIDVDFDSKRKNEVIEYVKNKYGEKRTLGIVTYSTLKSKMVLRDISRIFENANTENFIKLFDSKLTLKENLENKNIKSRIDSDPLLSKIFNISLKLEGLKRQTSIHAAGVVIASKDLDSYIPIIKNEDINLSGYQMDYLERLGLLKMDFLSLDNLTFIDNLTTKLGINIKDIPLDDKDTFEIFNDANTDGIFQFESMGIKDVLKKFKVTSFSDIVALIALYRPGPMDNIDSYIKRKEGKEKIDYIDPSLESILKETYGIIIYQEQIMMIASTMASYSMAEADLLRRIMSKKKEEAMNDEKDKFISKAIENGYSKEVSSKVFDLIHKFSSYGFNKSHSVAYSIISYWMAYLKAHYRKEFMLEMLNSVIKNDIKTKDYISDLRKYNIEVIKPDINKSTNEYILSNNKILLPLTCIKNISELSVKKLLEKRDDKEKDFFDYVRILTNIGFTRKEITALIDASAFDYTNVNHRTLIENLDNVINYAKLSNDLDDDSIEKPVINNFDEYSKEELLEKELNAFGLYLFNHPVLRYKDNDINTKDISNYFNKNITMYLLVNKKKQIETKEKKAMAFINAEDEFVSVEVVVFPKVFEKNVNIDKGNIIKVSGTVERRNSDYQLIANNIEKII